MLPFYLMTILVIVFAFVMGDRLPAGVWLLVLVNVLLAIVLPTWKAFKRAKARRVSENKRADSADSR